VFYPEFPVIPDGVMLASRRFNERVKKRFKELFHAYVEKHISSEGTKTLAEWQAYSGLDTHSKEAWFTLSASEAPRSRVFYNDTPETKVVDLGYTQYLDLDQNPVAGNLTLPPYSAQVLVASGAVADLSLTLALLGDPDVIPAAPLTYTLAVTNEGTYTATQVVLDHVIPVEITSTLWEASSSLAGLTAQPGTRYVWDLPDLTPGMTGVTTITGTFTGGLSASLPLALTTQVTTPVPEASTANNKARLLLGNWKSVYLPLVQLSPSSLR
jgi:hypothetical protein